MALTWWQLLALDLQICDGSCVEIYENEVLEGSYYPLNAGCAGETQEGSPVYYICQSRQFFLEARRVETKIAWSLWGFESLPASGLTLSAAQALKPEKFYSNVGASCLVPPAGPWHLERASLGREESPPRARLLPYLYPALPTERATTFVSYKIATPAWALLLTNCAGPCGYENDRQGIYVLGEHDNGLAAGGEAACLFDNSTRAAAWFKAENGRPYGKLLIRPDQPALFGPSFYQDALWTSGETTDCATWSCSTPALSGACPYFPPLCWQRETRGELTLQIVRWASTPPPPAPTGLFRSQLPALAEGHLPVGEHWFPATDAVSQKLRYVWPCPSGEIRFAPCSRRMTTGGAPGPVFVAYRRGGVCVLLYRALAENEVEPLSTPSSPPSSLGPSNASSVHPVWCIAELTTTWKLLAWTLGLDDEGFPHALPPQERWREIVSDEALDAKVLVRAFTLGMEVVAGEPETVRKTVRQLRGAPRAKDYLPRSPRSLQVGTEGLAVYVEGGLPMCTGWYLSSQERLGLFVLVRNSTPQGVPEPRRRPCCLFYQMTRHGVGKWLLSIDHVLGGWVYVRSATDPLVPAKGAMLPCGCTKGRAHPTCLNKKAGVANVTEICLWTSPPPETPSPPSPLLEPPIAQIKKKPLSTKSSPCAEIPISQESQQTTAARLREIAAEQLAAKLAQQEANQLYEKIIAEANAAAQAAKYRPSAAGQATTVARPPAPRGVSKSTVPPEPESRSKRQRRKAAKAELRRHTWKQRQQQEQQIPNPFAAHVKSVLAGRSNFGDMIKDVETAEKLVKDPTPVRELRESSRTHPLTFPELKQILEALGDEGF